MASIKAPSENKTASSRFAPGNIRLVHKGLVLVLIPWFFGLLFVGSLIYLVNQAEAEAQREVAAREVENRTATFGQVFFEANTIMLAYPFTRQASLLKRYKAIKVRAKQNYQGLRDLLKNDPELLRRIDHMMLLQRRSFMLLDELKKEELSMTEMLDYISVLGVREQTQSLLRQFVRELTEFRDVHKAAMFEFKPANPTEYAKNIRLVALAGAIAMIPLAILLVAYLGQGVARRLATVMDNASRLASKQALNPPVGGSDEIGRLDSVFHKMAQALQEAARRERAIVDNAQDVICSLDADNRFTEVSPASLNVWGYTADEILGRNLADIADSDFSDAIDFLNENSHLDMAEFSDSMGTSTKRENRVRRKDGTVKDMLWSMRWSAEQETYFCVAHDITQRKAAEELLKENEGRIRTIVESMPVALIITDAVGTIETCNMKAEQMFGWSNAEIANQHLKIVFKEFNELGDFDFMRMLEEKWLGRVSEVDAVRLDQSDFPFEFSISSFEYRGELKLMMIALDVTERHEIERWKQEFIQMVSHDLRTPLTSVLGTLSIFSTGKFGKLNEKGLSTVERCESEIDRLMALIDELLDLEKFQAGKMKMEFDVVDLSSVVERAVSAVSYVADKSGVKIEASSSIIQGLADGPKLVQVLVNLLSNAIKFSPSNSTIRVQYRCIEGGGKVPTDAHGEETESKDAGGSWAAHPQFIEFAVSDEGRGIPASQLEIIFERFKQVEASDHAAKGGKGLGLSICKSIVEAHGGSIWVESTEGQGSTFKFLILSRPE